MMQTGVGPLPPRFVELKKEIVAAYPDFEQRATKAWGEILQELKAATDDIAAKGSDVCFISCSTMSISEAER